MAKTKIKPDTSTPKDIENARVSLFLEYLEKVNWLTKFMPTIEDYIEQRIDTYHAIMYKMAKYAKQPNSVTNKMLLGESVSEKEINKYVSKIEMAKLTSDPIEYFTYQYVIRFIAVTSIIARFENYLDFDMDGSVKSKDLKKMVKGLMVESYLEEGSQKVDGKVFGQSITDPCLGWAQTKELILKLAGN